MNPLFSNIKKPIIINSLLKSFSFIRLSHWIYISLLYSFQGYTFNSNNLIQKVQKRFEIDPIEFWTLPIIGGDELIYLGKKLNQCLTSQSCQGCPNHRQCLDCLWFIEISIIEFQVRKQIIRYIHHRHQIHQSALGPRTKMIERLRCREVRPKCSDVSPLLLIQGMKMSCI